ncbi:MAG: hypothetical protein ACLR78_02075 [Roseburia sp.]
MLVRTRNYQDAVLTVNVSAANKIVPQKQSIDVSTITYGEPLSKSRFYGVYVCGAWHIKSGCGYTVMEGA